MLPLANVSGQRVLVMPISDESGRSEHGESVRLQRLLSDQSVALAIQVVSREDLDQILLASGFSRVMLWTSADARAFASLARADEFLFSTIKPEGAGHRVVVRLHLQRDPSLRQPLVDSVFATASAGVDRAIEEYARARKQLAGERACVNAARSRDFAAALRAADDAIHLYARATLARLCKLNVMLEQHTKPAEFLTQARAMVEIDSTSVYGLGLLAEAFRQNAHPDSAAFMTARQRELVWRGHAVTVVNEWRTVGEALRAVDSAVAVNPGDPEMLRLRWLILLAAKQNLRAISEGEKLEARDSSFADTTYFIRHSFAYEALGHREQALALIERGLAKFPGYPALLDRKRSLSR